MRLDGFLRLFCVCLLLTLGMRPAYADGLKPFVLAAIPPQPTLTETVKAVKSALRAQGLNLVGSYSPYENAAIIIVTNAELKNNAAISRWGGYGAAQRVAVTKVDDAIQISYTHPLYMFTAYRMNGSVERTQAQLEAALGKRIEFGSEDGLDPEELQNYSFMIGLEKFDSVYRHLLAKFPSHKEAVRAVESGLASGKHGISKIYRIDIPGKDEVVFGVSIKEGRGSDQRIMERIDFAELKSTAHLPCEVLVSGNTVYHLFARYRITVNFPDLHMFGMNSFASILQAPKAIKKSLTNLVTPEELVPSE